MRGKKAEANGVGAPAQGKLLDIPRSNAAIEADRYVEITADLESRKELLNQQAEQVVSAMHAIKQRTLTIKDQMGYSYTFTLADLGEKLKVAKKGA